MEGSDLCPCHPSPGKPPTDSLQRAGDGAVTRGTDTDVRLLAEASETARPGERSSVVERMDKHSFPETKHQAVGISKMDNHQLHGT